MAVVIAAGMVPAVVVGVLAGVSVWSVRVAWATTVATRVRGRLAPVDRPSLPAPPRWFAVAVDRAGLGWGPESAWAAWVAAGVVAPAGGLLTGGPALAVIAAVAATVGPLAALRAATGRSERGIERAVPALLERVARSLRAGAAPAGALREAAHDGGDDVLATDLAAVVADVDGGEPLVVALDGWAERRPLPSIRLAVAALALGAETGGAQAQALDGLATTLRDRLAVAAEIRALSSQARLSALVITLAPLGFALFSAAADPRSAQFLLRTPAGIACLSIGLALDAIAAWWMTRLTRTSA